MMEEFISPNVLSVDYYPCINWVNIFLKDGGIHWDICSFDGKGNNISSSLDNKY